MICVKKHHTIQCIKRDLPNNFSIYPLSPHRGDNHIFCMADNGEIDVLIADGDAGLSDGVGIENSNGLNYYPLSHANACNLRKLFPFTAPKPILSNAFTVGVGDRIGLATPGLIRVFRQYDAMPVFAQQSIRELNLTGRTYADVLDSATFAVFREDFQKGFGADGDHLKTDAEVEYALSNGYTMITLDCSMQICNDVTDMTDEEVNAAYIPDPKLEERYCNKTFNVEDISIVFSICDFRRTVLIYGAAVDHAVRIYENRIAGKNVDFEISIDETATPTTPAQHYFVASELVRRRVKVRTIAPRFCGEFQKGIDYIGDLNQFEKEMRVHAGIARHFGYKLSIHSGSDKFSVFPIIGQLTQGNVHVKTAGTNWLEAMCVVAMTDAGLYREIHDYALRVFNEAAKYYHVTTDLSKIPLLDTLSDAQLPLLFAQNDARQLIHITYGLILGARNSDDSYRFKDRLYALWHKQQTLYADRLEEHIGRHLELLYRDIPRQD